MDDEMQELYTWVDDIPLSRPKRNIARDFSDGGALAAVVVVVVRLRISATHTP